MSRDSEKRGVFTLQNIIGDFSSMSKESLLAFVREQLLAAPSDSPERIFLNDCYVALDPTSSLLAVRYAVGRLKIYSDEMMLLRVWGDKKKRQDSENSEKYTRYRPRFFSAQKEQSYNLPKNVECLLRAVLNTFDQPKVIDLEK